MPRYWVKGTALNAEDRKHVLSAYVHRFTLTHRPSWANAPGYDYRPHFRDDADWLEHTRFAATRQRADGSYRLDRRVRSCESSPTWPEGTGNALTAGAEQGS